MVACDPAAQRRMGLPQPPKGSPSGEAPSASPPHKCAYILTRPLQSRQHSTAQDNSELTVHTLSRRHHVPVSR